MLSRCFLSSFKSIGLSVQEKKRKIDFQDGHHGGHLGFRIATILAICDQVIPMLPTEFQVNWPFCSGEEAKNIFTRWPPQRPSWISDGNDFSYFWSTRCFLLSYKSVGPSVQEKKRKTDFQDGGQLGFSIEAILVSFDLLITTMLSTKFQVNRPFGSGEEAKNIFSRWPPWWRPSLISDLNDFSYFFYYSYQVSNQLTQGCRSRILKQVVDAPRRTTQDARRTTHDSRRTTEIDQSQCILVLSLSPIVYPTSTCRLYIQYCVVQLSPKCILLAQA